VALLADVLFFIVLIGMVAVLGLSFFRQLAIEKSGMHVFPGKEGFSAQFIPVVLASVIVTLFSMILLPLFFVDKPTILWLISIIVGMSLLIFSLIYCLDVI
jgi:hypothetical protein